MLWQRSPLDLSLFRRSSELPDLSGSDSSGGAPDQAVLSVGCSAGVGGWVVF